jgi:hypothetical protein
MSVNMLIETPGGFDYTFDDFKLWTRQAGFKSSELITLNKLMKAAIAYK